MFLVTSTSRTSTVGLTIRAPTPAASFGDFAEARAEAETRAKEGEQDVRVWALACSVVVETKAVWQEYRALDPVFAPEFVETLEVEEQ